MLTRFKEKYIGDAAFYKRYLYLALPMILQNAITNMVSFLDNIMVGQLGTEQMSGVAFCIQSGNIWCGICSQHFWGTVLRKRKS